MILEILLIIFLTWVGSAILAITCSRISYRTGESGFPSFMIFAPIINTLSVIWFIWSFIWTFICGKFNHLIKSKIFHQLVGLLKRIWAKIRKWNYLFLRWAEGRPKFEVRPSGIPFSIGDKVEFKTGEIHTVLDINANGSIRVDNNSELYYFVTKGNLDHV